MNSIFIILLTFVSLDDDTSFSSPTSFGSTPLTQNFKTIIHKSHQDCQDALMQIFSAIPQEYNPTIEKYDDDTISITNVGAGVFMDINFKRKFVCKEITLQ